MMWYVWWEYTRSLARFNILCHVYQQSFRKDQRNYGWSPILLVLKYNMTLETRPPNELVKGGFVSMVILIAYVGVQG